MSIEEEKLILPEPLKVKPSIAKYLDKLEDDGKTIWAFEGSDIIENIFYLHLDIAEKYGVYNALPFSVYDVQREEGTNPWLIGLFCLAASLINIHLLNMLIALMGDTFSTSNDVYSKIKVKEKIQWWMIL
jgi:hypothetical protein